MQVCMTFQVLASANLIFTFDDEIASIEEKFGLQDTGWGELDGRKPGTYSSFIHP
jgi:hypothetical protein